MRTAGFDPYDAYIRAEEERQARWEATRPICGACGDRILDRDRYDLNGQKVCEDCIDEAWDVIQKNMHRLFIEEYAAHSDYFVMEAIVERMIEAFDLEEFKQEIGEENDDVR